MKLTTSDTRVIPAIIIVCHAKRFHPAVPKTTFGGFKGPNLNAHAPVCGAQSMLNVEVSVHSNELTTIPLNIAIAQASLCSAVSIEAGLHGWHTQ